MQRSVADHEDPVALWIPLLLLLQQAARVRYLHSEPEYIGNSEHADDTSLSRTYKIVR